MIIIDVKNNEIIESPEEEILEEEREARHDHLSKFQLQKQLITIDGTVVTE